MAHDDDRVRAARAAASECVRASDPQEWVDRVVAAILRYGDDVRRAALGDAIRKISTIPVRDGNMEVFAEEMAYHGAIDDAVDAIKELAARLASPTDGGAAVDVTMQCATCGLVPHRFRPSPEAGPYWRCSECGEPTDGGAAENAYGVTRNATPEEIARQRAAWANYTPGPRQATTQAPAEPPKPTGAAAKCGACDDHPLGIRVGQRWQPCWSCNGTGAARADGEE